METGCRSVTGCIGRDGEVYNIAGACHLPNLEVINRVLKIVGAAESLVTRVADRPGHDRRYALRGDKIARDTGFVPEIDFDLGLGRTAQWYRENAEWIRRVRSGEYREYYSRNYDWRVSSVPAGGRSATMTESAR
jgi:dTDP-glucose 4,6-dehydratase